MTSSRSIVLYLAFLSGVVATSLRSPEAGPRDGALTNLETMALFSQWTEEHGKVYNSHEEEGTRLSIWLENHQRIEDHNNQDPPPSFTLGHNAFSDLTPDEFARKFNLGKYSNAEFSKLHMQEQLTTMGQEESKQTRHLDTLDLPDYVNWVQMGGVTPVKNQGACGSCWAFSTTGALEGAKFIQTGELVALSEQNLLDCDHKDLGCNGGLMDNAFKFDEKTGGLCSEADYPYEAKQNKVCRTNCTDVPGTIVRTFYDVPPGDLQALIAAISMQPISVAIQADQFVFQFYKTGVLTDSSCGARGNIDHGVLAVGYGTDLETQEPYFLVKNSWGASWGESGYIRMSRNSENEFGMCAILKMASYPETE